MMLLSSFSLFGQAGRGAQVFGVVRDSTGSVLEGVNVYYQASGTGTISDAAGRYLLTIPSDTLIDLQFSYVGFQVTVEQVRLKEGQEMELNIQMHSKTAILNDVLIRDEQIRDEVSLTEILPETIESLPSAFGDFNRILVTLPGVQSNNELSSTYSVRGGNFDENLVYVNDIPIYRPQLVSNGQQEGLSFINPDLVESVRFSAGGWQPKYGDKLSSVLNVKYKKPRSFSGSASIALLGGSAHVERTDKTQRVTYVAGIRHKASQYLLNTLETQGGYRPRFTDLQGYVNIRLDKNPKARATTLGLLASYARNRYRITPESRETQFGTFSQALRFTVAFEGKEIMEYDTWQGGARLTHWLNDRWRSDLIVSGVKGYERENTDVEGGYRICDVDTRIGSNTFNECLYVRGIGTQYDYGRNRLAVDLLHVESKNSILLKNNSTLEFGLSYDGQKFDDYLNEYSFIDSAGYVTELNSLRSASTLSNPKISAYVQYSGAWGEKWNYTGGMRLTRVSINREILASPRVQVSFTPEWVRDVVFRASAGMYSQPGFFRELRDMEGEVHTDVRAQKSFHLIGGMDYNFKWWGRDFTFLAEAYYKKLWDVVAYDVDNVKLRYYANNDTRAFATGLDLRISGEFIPGALSWFSLGILDTKEDLGFDHQGYLRRPTDQRVTLSMVFQDHLPNDPMTRVNLNLQFGTGLPFGPPGNVDQRAYYSGDMYRRVDIGFSHLFYLKESDKNQTLLVTAEVLNLLGSDNPISYTFVEDIYNNRFAVPNSLSARFLNIKVTWRW